MQMLVTWMWTSYNDVSLDKIYIHEHLSDNSFVGAFRFNFWRFGAWVETTVDDYLPVLDERLMYCNALGEPPEFWGALLEKAYAK